MLVSAGERGATAPADRAPPEDLACAMGLAHGGARSPATAEPPDPRGPPLRGRGPSCCVIRRSARLCGRGRRRARAWEAASFSYSNTNIKSARRTSRETEKLPSPDPAKVSSTQR